MTVNGGTLRCLGIAEITVQHRENRASLTALVVPDRPLGMDVVLGMPGIVALGGVCVKMSNGVEFARLYHQNFSSVQLRPAGPLSQWNGSGINVLGKMTVTVRGSDSGEVLADIYVAVGQLPLMGRDLQQQLALTVRHGNVVCQQEVEDDESELVACLADETSAVSREELAVAGREDAEVRALMDQIPREWPRRFSDVDDVLRPYFRCKQELAIDGLHRLLSALEYRRPRWTCPVSQSPTLLRRRPSGCDGERQSQSTPLPALPLVT
ncbi:hypothetical protein FJT64_009449 [Amphibalanus amphitrite]|uniref:Uncharacterized protein n=1 Tax=Amphibalanus amphitrite TaxID=1232801 RepID=A0A6A4VM05_AMPAM|nr:hypothetical protein FJT64_009449 [Amphibalanus amphitrite]